MSARGNAVNRPGKSLAGQYLELTKPKVVMLIVFTAIVGMFLSVPNMVPLDILVLGTVGIWLLAASAAVINHVIDQRADAVMTRTQHRPLPRGRVSRRAALWFALALCVAGLLILVLGVNLLTAVLTFASLIGYAVIYTAFLKRATPQNIVIGGAAGAAPPVLGWAAVTGEVHPHSLLLFLIIFAWTPPHFWALAIYRKDDYAAVNIPMLPVIYGTDFTRWHIFFYTVILFICTLLPYLTGMSGLVYLGGAVALSGGFVWYAVRMLRDHSPILAMRTFGYSIVQLMALFALLLVDHYLLYRA